MKTSYQTLEDARTDGWVTQWLTLVAGDLSEPYRIYAGRKRIDGKFAVQAIRSNPYGEREFILQDHRLWIAEEVGARGEPGSYLIAVRSEDLIAAMNEALDWVALSTQAAA